MEKFHEIWKSRWSKEYFVGLQLYLGSQRHWGNILRGLSLEMLGHSPDSSARLPLAHPMPGKGGNQHRAGDFPGGPVVKNPPSNAGDKCSIPSQGTKIPHATKTQHRQQQQQQKKTTARSPKTQRQRSRDREWIFKNEMWKPSQAISLRCET